LRSISTDQHRVAIVLISSGICLLLLHYLKLASTFQSFLNISALYRFISPYYYELLSYCWWAWWHLLAYLLLPLLVIKYVLHDSITNYGVRFAGVVKHLKWYILLILPILGGVIAVSFRDDFSTHYPFYRLAHRSWLDLLTWELLYLGQFACLEFFFRGFMVLGCRPVLGNNSVWVMAVPYLMLHFPKPWLEATGALFFGIFLGFLVLRSGSIWGGILVHWSIALSMDIAALLQTSGSLPTRWF